MQKRLTIRDIARIANVSPSTVSRSLNDSPLVAEETKAQIREIARNGNFSFNATARSLVTQRTGIVGLICPDSYNEYQYSLHLTLLINQIRSVLETQDLDLIVKFRFDANKQNTVRHLLTSQKVDALIVINPDITPDEVRFIHETRIPVVFVQAIPPHLDLSDENYVFADHVAGGTIATDHLLRLGHRRILCFTVDTHESSFHERTDGYRRTLEDHNIPVDEELIVVGDGTFQFGYDYVTQNAERFGSDITAVFAQTDIMALGAIEGLWDSGLQVPKDVAIVSYDDIGFGKDFRPRLTTVHQPRDRLAVAACSKLGELLDAAREADRDQELADTDLEEIEETGEADNTRKRTMESGRKPGRSARLQRRVQPYLVVRESCGAD